MSFSQAHQEDTGLFFLLELAPQVHKELRHSQPLSMASPRCVKHLVWQTDRMILFRSISNVCCGSMPQGAWMLCRSLQFHAAGFSNNAHNGGRRNRDSLRPVIWRNQPGHSKSKTSLTMLQRLQQAGTSRQSGLHL